MSSVPKDFLPFLKDLKKNNNREWFHANKKRYESSLKEPFKELVGDVIKLIQKSEPDIQIEPKDGIFRINRDIRFSKDKSPYKTNVGAIISAKGKKQKDYPGYYLHIEGGNLMIGGGMYFVQTPDLKKMREHIAAEMTRFNKIIKAKKFTSVYGGIQGEANKRIPKEFQEAHEKQPLIANKQFYFMSEHDPKKVLAKDPAKFIVKTMLAGKDLNQFMKEIY